MSNKWDDYAKVLAIITSCTKSRQQIVAFNVIMNFDKKWNDEALYYSLNDALDDNLIKIVGRYRK